jgi:hypothetical protein
MTQKSLSLDPNQEVSRRTRRLAIVYLAMLALSLVAWKLILVDSESFFFMAPFYGWAIVPAGIIVGLATIILERRTPIDPSSWQAISLSMILYHGLFFLTVLSIDRIVIKWVLKNKWRRGYVTFAEILFFIAYALLMTTFGTLVVVLLGGGVG